LATQKAQDPQIKEFAQKLVTDHSKVGDELKQLAEKEGITLSTEVEPKKQKMMDHLSGLSGAEFDKAFTSHMARDHKKDVAMFKKAASSDDAAIREFAKNTLPTLQEHLRTVQQWAPEAAAGTELQEPAGAEKKSDDANKLDQQNQDQQNQQQNQDQNNQDQNQTPSPDSAGQASPK
jgi:putative membrane protein